MPSKVERDAAYTTPAQPSSLMGDDVARNMEPGAAANLLNLLVPSFDTSFQSPEGHSHEKYVLKILSSITVERTSQIHVPSFGT